jgi:hypothetical protein
MKNDFDGLKQLFHGFFASIPHQWYTNNDIQSYEGYYASVFYSYFASLGLIWYWKTRPIWDGST